MDRVKEMAPPVEREERQPERKGYPGGGNVTVTKVTEDYPRKNANWAQHY